MKAKQKSFISNNNSNNLYYRPNSSNKSKISHRQLSRINNSLTELYPPIQFTMPRTRKASSHMGNLITKEELYEENMQLKSSLKRLKKELEESKKYLFKKGLELEKKEKIINDCHKENVTEIEHEQYLHKAKESSILSLCRQKYTEMKTKYEKECKQNDILRMNIKLIKLKEYQIQIDTYQKEMEKLRKLYLNSKENLNNVINELKNLKEIKGEYINQHSLINTIRKKCDELNEKIKIFQEENSALKNEIDKNQTLIKKLKQSNVKLRLSNEKYMKMKKVQEGSYLVNKDNVLKLQSLEKDLKEYKTLYEKQSYEYKKLTNIVNKKGNIINSDLLNTEKIGFLNAKIIEKRVENNQEELYKSLLNNEKIKNNILESFLKEQGFDIGTILKEKGYDGIIHKEIILNHKSSKNLQSENYSQNTKCATSVGNKDNFEQSKKLNNTQSNLENNYKQSFTQEQLRDSTEENFENIQNNNDINENQGIITDSQNSELYVQEQYRKDNQILSLSQVYMKNFEANHISKDAFINKIKEISTLFENKEEITKENFLEPFINLFINLMRVTNDKDALIIKEFFNNLIEETEGDTNKFFFELIEIAHNIVDYSLVENEEEIINVLANELMPFKHQLKSSLEKFGNNLITFDSLKKIFNELKININDDYYQFLLYKMKTNTPEKSSIFELNYKIILEILDKNINLNSTYNFPNLSNNTNKEEKKINEEDNELEDKINLQIGLVLKELKQTLSNNNTNFEEECKSIIHNLDFENKKLKGIEKEDFFKIFKKYKIQVEEKIKEYIFELFKLENIASKNKENDSTLIDYDRIWSLLKD